MVDHQTIESSISKMHLTFKLSLFLGLINLPEVYVIKSQNENQNVLVPNNDVNFNAKLKTLINGDSDGDYEDFVENNISEQISSPKIVKLFSKNLLKTNKVNDDVNKNIDENKIDLEDHGSDDDDNDSVTDFFEIINTTGLNETQLSNDPLLVNITKLVNDTENQLITLSTPTLRTVTVNESPVEVTTPNVLENINTRNNECLLGNANLFLWWVNLDGTLKDDNIINEGFKKHQDHSYKFKNETQYAEYLHNQENLNKFKVIKVNQINLNLYNGLFPLIGVSRIFGEFSLSSIITNEKLLIKSIAS